MAWEDLSQGSLEAIAVEAYETDVNESQVRRLFGRVIVENGELPWILRLAKADGDSRRRKAIDMRRIDANVISKSLNDVYLQVRAVTPRLRSGSP